MSMMYRVLYDQSKFNVVNIKFCNIDCKLRQLSKGQCRKLKSTSRRLFSSVTRRSISYGIPSPQSVIAALRVSASITRPNNFQDAQFDMRKLSCLLRILLIHARARIKSLNLSADTILFPRLDLPANPYAISAKSSKRTSDSRCEYR